MSRKIFLDLLVIIRSSKFNADVTNSDIGKGCLKRARNFIEVLKNNSIPICLTDRTGKEGGIFLFFAGYQYPDWRILLPTPQFTYLDSLSG